MYPRQKTEVAEQWRPNLASTPHHRRVSSSSSNRADSLTRATPKINFNNQQKIRDTSVAPLLDFNALSSLPIDSSSPGLALQGWTSDTSRLAAVALTQSEQLPQHQHAPQAGMMNNRGHLPAGQQAQGGADMGPVAPGGPGPRRGGRPQQHYPPAHHYHHHQHVGQPMYANNYMASYAGTHYYVPQPYQAAAMPGPGYMPYAHTGYGRSPPAMQHYVPMQQNYGRPPQHSPIVSSPYQPPLPGVTAAIPPPPHTPSSTHSHVAPPPHMPAPIVHGLEEVALPQVPVQLPQHPEPYQPEPQIEPQPAVKPEPQPEVSLPKPPSEPLVTPSSTVSISPPRDPFRPPVSSPSVPMSRVHKLLMLI